MIGRTLAHYQVTAAIGAGGMGEVLRARDTRLNRDVAIKILPPALAQDADRVGRFRREAQILATLNHPNIASIYGLEDVPAGGEGEPAVVALVMELVEGDDLAARLRGGRVPADEAIGIAIQIAEALEEAHEKGIVHRDLKPANVKVTPEGKVKVLDFGLAKALDTPSPDSHPADLSRSPTMSRVATEAGLILGTAAYMSPEQARGKTVDKRADIWSFGVVLYEMLTGNRLFTGETVSDVLAAVLTRDPTWAALPPEVPPRVRDVLRRCLDRNPKQRLHDIADARLILQEPEAGASPAAAPEARPSSSVLGRLGPALAGAALAALIAAILWPRGTGSTAAPTTRLAIVAPPGTSLFPDSALAVISPDGTMVVFAVGDYKSVRQLWLRPLDSLTARRIDGGEGGDLPFWSPDSRHVGFFSEDKLKVVSVDGGRVLAISDVVAGSSGRGGAWSSANVIVFAPDVAGPLFRVSANGGEATPVTTLDPALKQWGHRFPTFLPDGDHFLYAALPGRNGKFDIFAGSLSGGPPILVGSMETSPVYAEPGYLLYGRQNVLVAQPFDPRSLRLIGEAVSLEDAPVSIVEPTISFTAGPITSVSRTGSLAYFSAPRTNTAAIWLDASGKQTGTLSIPEGRYTGLRISPDGAHAVLVRSRAASESSLWLADLERGGAIPLSSGPGRNDMPVWSPDGTRVVFASDRDGPLDLFVKTIGDAAPEQPFYRSPDNFKNPESWSPDGRFLVFTSFDPATAVNIWLLPTSGEKTPVPYVRGPLRDLGTSPSPDGRWLAYLSDETGRFELYTQSFPEPGKRQQVTSGGGVGRWWSRDSRDLYFLKGEPMNLWHARMEAGDSGRWGAPEHIAVFPPDIQKLEATPDLKRFLALMNEQSGPGWITVVQNWRSSLK